MGGRKLNENEQVAEEIHRPARRNYGRLRTQMRGINDTLQADLVEMIPYARHNRGMKYILTVINIFSKKAYARPLKNKSAEDVKMALESIIRSLGHPIRHIHTDRGREFYNNTVRGMLQQHNIHLYSTFSRMKAAICERFNRTLKSRMFKRFSLLRANKWLDILPKLVAEYNNTKHRTIKMRPNDVNMNNEESLLLNIYSYADHRKAKIKFKAGDAVRMSKHKHVFEKGYTPNWTTEVFTIRRVRRTDPVTYFLKDWQDNNIEGAYYAEELLLAKYPDVYLIEKVLRRRDNQVYVKWLGFGEEFNQWIDKKNLRN